MNLVPSSLAQWVGAVATSSAVIVALFKDRVFHLFRRPKLTISISPKPPDCVLSTMNGFDRYGNLLWAGKAYWLRFWVQNGGKERAEQVQVFVSKVYKQGANKKPVQMADFLPMNLRWANARDWHNPEIFAPGISSKPLGKHCDLCFVSDPANPRDKLEGHEGQCVATLQVETFPTSNVHRLPPGEYLIEVIVAAANAGPITVYLELNLTGRWSTDPDVMFRDYLSVQLVPNPF